MQENAVRRNFVGAIVEALHKASTACDVSRRSRLAEHLLHCILYGRSSNVGVNLCGCTGGMAHTSWMIRSDTRCEASQALQECRRLWKRRSSILEFRAADHALEAF